MNSIKNAIVTTTLLAVGYGSYIVLKAPAPGHYSQAMSGYAAPQDDPFEPASYVPQVQVSVAPPEGTSHVPPSSELVAPVQISTGQNLSGATAQRLGAARFDVPRAPKTSSTSAKLPEINLPNFRDAEVASTIAATRDAVASQIEKTQDLARETIENVKSELPPLPNLLGPDAGSQLPTLTTNIAPSVSAEVDPEDSLRDIAAQAAEKLQAEIIEPLKAKIIPPVATLVEPKTVPPPFASTKQINPFKKPLDIDQTDEMPMLPSVGNWDEYKGPPISATEAAQQTGPDAELARSTGNVVSELASATTLSSPNEIRSLERIDQSSLTAAPVNASSVAPLTPDAPAQTELGSSSPNLAFERVWTEVQSLLAAKEYARALKTLTPWNADSNLSKEQNSRCINLLDQLAGAIIYSRENTLEHPYVVQAGETLEEIGLLHGVPHDLLAKINGIAPPYALATGEKLKVVRGPFRAVVRMSSSELTLFAGSYYAGRFSVQIGRDLPPESAFYEVAEKSAGRTYFDRKLGREVIRNEPANRYGDYWLGLRGEHITSGHSVGIHGRSNEFSESNIGSISLAPADAEDVFSILSVGSRIEVRP